MRNSNNASVNSYDGLSQNHLDDGYDKPKQTNLSFMSKLTPSRFANSCEPKNNRKRLVEKARSSNIILNKGKERFKVPENPLRLQNVTMNTSQKEITIIDDSRQ